MGIFGKLHDELLAAVAFRIIVHLERGTHCALGERLAGNLGDEGVSVLRKKCAGGIAERVREPEA